MADRARENAATYHSGRTLMLVSLAIGVVVAGLLGWATVRRITGPLSDVSATLARVADGDLTGVVAVRSSDEVGSMAGSLNRATASMRGTVSALGMRRSRWPVRP